VDLKDFYENEFVHSNHFVLFLMVSIEVRGLP